MSGPTIDAHFAVAVTVDCTNGEVVNMSVSNAGLFYDAETKVWDVTEETWRSCHAGHESNGVDEGNRILLDLLKGWAEA